MRKSQVFQKQCFPPVGPKDELFRRSGPRKERDMDGGKLHEKSMDKGYRKVKGRDFLGFPLGPKKV